MTGSGEGSYSPSFSMRSSLMGLESLVFASVYTYQFKSV